MGVLYLVIVGQLVSLIGTSIQSMAIPLYILHETGSALLVSISQLITIVVTVVVSPLAGVVGDRYNRKRLLVGSDAASGAIVMVMFALFALGVRGLPFIFLCQALCAVSECMLVSSLFAIIPDLFSGKNITRVNAIRGMGTSIALFVGPMVGGLVYGFLGIKYVFLINALSFFFSAALASFIQYKRHVLAKPGRISFGSFLADLKEIWTYLSENEGIRRIARFAIFLNLLSAPILYVVLPFLIVKVIRMSDQQYGLIQGFYMAGFFLGGLMLSALKLRDVKKLVKPALFVMSVATLVLSALSVPAAASFGSMAAISALIVLIGYGDSVSGTIVQSEIQSSARPDVVSRLGGILNMAYQAPIPVGLIIVGPLVDFTYAKTQAIFWVFIPMALILLLFTLFASRNLFAAIRAVPQPSSVEETPGVPDA